MRVGIGPALPSRNAPHNCFLYDVKCTKSDTEPFRSQDPTIQLVAKNYLQTVPLAPAQAHITPFLKAQDLANLRGASKQIAHLGKATYIIATYGLAPLIENYCLDKIGENEEKAIKALRHFVAFAEELSHYEGLELPSYSATKDFFSLIEARNLVRMAARMNATNFLSNFQGPLKIGRVASKMIQRATLVRDWFDRQRGALGAFSELDLSSCNLTLLPPEIGQLQGLITLCLSSNHLTKLTKKIGQLKILTELLLGDNDLTSLPKEIGQLSALIVLDVSHNRLTCLPKEIGRLKTLVRLILFHNHLGRLPKEIGRLRILSFLHLNHNRLTDIPREIGQLKALTRLWLNYNHLTRIPGRIGRLKKLEVFYLGHNRLIHLPREIGKLKNLEGLFLSHNRLMGIPREIVELEGLGWLSLSKNRLTSMHEEMAILAVDQYCHMDISNNGLVELPLKLKIYEKQLEKQNKRLQTTTLLKRMITVLKNGHDCQRIASLLNDIEKIIGVKMRSKLHHCLYEVCKNTFASNEKIKNPKFGRKAFVDPKINHKLKLAAISLFWKGLKDRDIIRQYQ